MGKNINYYFARQGISTDQSYSYLPIQRSLTKSSM